jgi:hypothetical protein
MRGLVSRMRKETASGRMRRKEEVDDGVEFERDFRVEGEGRRERSNLFSSPNHHPYRSLPASSLHLLPSQSLCSLPHLPSLHPSLPLSFVVVSPFPSFSPCIPHHRGVCCVFASLTVCRSIDFGDSEITRRPNDNSRGDRSSDEGKTVAFTFFVSSCDANGDCDDKRRKKRSTFFVPISEAHKNSSN